MLSIGLQAPDFELPDDQGRPVRLSRELARGPLVLYFYPADFTPLCTREACHYRDRHAELLAAGVGILGVSPQAAESHAGFRGRHGLPFPLLTDADRLVTADYGARGPLGTRRITYLIGRDGRVEDRARAALRLGPHRALVDRAIAQYGTA